MAAFNARPPADVARSFLPTDENLTSGQSSAGGRQALLQPSATPDSGAAKNQAGLARQFELLQILKPPARQEPVSASPGGAQPDWDALSADNCFLPFAHRYEEAFSARLLMAFTSKLAAFTSQTLADTAYPHWQKATYLGQAVFFPEKTTLTMDNQRLDANLFFQRDVAGRQIPVSAGIACCYPRTHALNNHFRMMYEQHPSMLVVLTGDEEIAHHSLPPYFKQSDTFGRIECKVVKDFESELPVRVTQYTMQLTPLVSRAEMASGKEPAAGVLQTKTIPVIHVRDWPDGTALPDVKLIPLLNLMHGLQKAADANGRGRELLLHCNAGVGRGPYILATYQIAFKPEHIVSAQALAEDVRLSRGNWGIFAPGQQRGLARLAALRGIPVLSGELKSPTQASLLFLGYPDARGAGNSLMEALTYFGCSMTSGVAVINDTSDTAAAAEELAAIDPDKACVMDILAGDEMLDRMLWPAGDHCQGRRERDLCVFPGNPADFVKQLKRTPNSPVQLTGVRWHQIGPTQAACDLGLWLEKPPAEIQVELVGHSRAIHVTNMKTINDLNDFLNFVEKPVFCGQHKLDEVSAPVLANALHHGDRVMMELCDDTTNQNYRALVRKRGGTDGAENGIELVRTDGKDQVVRHFGSAGALVQSLLDQRVFKDLHLTIDIISAEMLDGIEMECNYAYASDEESDASDASSDVTVIEDSPQEDDDTDRED